MNWQDVTEGLSPGTTEPDAVDPVATSGLTGTIYQAITGGRAAAGMVPSGYEGLKGTHAAGVVAIRTMLTFSAGTAVSGGLILGAAADPLANEALSAGAPSGANSEDTHTWL